MIAIFQGAGSEELLRHVSDRVVSQIGFAPEGLAVVGGATGADLDALPFTQFCENGMLRRRP